MEPLTSRPWLGPLRRAAWEVGSSGCSGGGRGTRDKEQREQSWVGCGRSHPGKPAFGEEMWTMLTLSGHFLRTALCVFFPQQLMRFLTMDGKVVSSLSLGGMQAGGRVNNYQGGCRGDLSWPGSWTRLPWGTSTCVAPQPFLLVKADQQVRRGRLSDTG